MSRPKSVSPGFLLFLLPLLSPGPSASACDSTSCSLLTRGASGLVPKKRFRFDLTFGYTDLGRLQRGSQEVDTVLRPRVFLGKGLIIPNFHRDVDGYPRW